MSAAEVAVDVALATLESTPDGLLAARAQRIVALADRVRFQAGSLLIVRRDGSFADSRTVEELRARVIAREQFQLGDTIVSAAQVLGPIAEVIKLVERNATDDDIRAMLMWVPLGVPAVEGLRLRLAELLGITEHLPGNQDVGGGRMQLR